MEDNSKASLELYGKIQKAIDLLDSRFFSGKGKQRLPDVVFAINNMCKSSMTAYVSPEALYDKKSDKKLQYLGINPRHLNRGLEGILATLCHEMCHVYENAYIHIPRGGYHDKKWEELMDDCGLEAVPLNKSRTAVATRIKDGGEFEEWVKIFREECGEDYFNIVEYSQELVHEIRVALGLGDGDGDGDEPKADNADKPVKKYNRNKTKYTCPDCGAHVWGKSGLHIECSDCGRSFEEENEEDDDE